MAILTREQILNSNDLPSELVDMPAWGGSVLVSRLSGLDRAELDDVFVALKGEKAHLTHQDYYQYLMELLARALQDEQRQRLFRSAEDIAQLARKSDEAIAALAEVAMRLNGLAPQTVDEAKKNSEPHLNGALPSSSPDLSA